MLEALLHNDCKRYLMIAAVVMDDHVHALFKPRADIDVGIIIGNWKSNATTRMKPLGRRQSCWQEEYYCRVVRDDAALRTFARYIANNPIERWPYLKNYPWVWVSDARVDAVVAGGGVEETWALEAGRGDSRVQPAGGRPPLGGWGNTGRA